MPSQTTTAQTSSEVQGSQGWEVLLPQLVQPLRCIEILQPLLSEVPEFDLDQAGRRIGENCLATMRRRADACRPVDIDTDIALVGQERLARVDADADAHLAGGQRGLSLLSCRQSIGGFRERVKEGIPCVSTSTPPWL